MLDHGKEGLSDKVNLSCLDMEGKLLQARSRKCKGPEAEIIRDYHCFYSENNTGRRPRGLEWRV